MKSFTLALLLTLVLAVPAMAQGPSQDGYTPDGPQAIEQTSGSGGDPGNAQTAQTDDTGSLPFTGLDLVLVAALGAGLLGVGAGMRRLTRPTGPTSF